MNKNFKDKQKEIDKLNKKSTAKKSAIEEIKLSKIYWLCVILFYLIIFPIMGSILVNAAVGFIVFSISTISVTTALFLCKGIEWKVSKNLSKLNNDIDIKEKNNEENAKDLETLKKHITPAHIEYNIKQNNTNEIETEQCIDNFFVEDTKEETEKKEVEGPTLVKRKKRR